MTTELSQLLEEEEKRWMETLHIEEYQITLAKTVIQVSGSARVCLNLLPSSDQKYKQQARRKVKKNLIIHKVQCVSTVSVDSG